MERGKSKLFMARARDFVLSAQDARQQQRNDVAVSNAAHAVIFSCDALTVHLLGVRCRWQDHRELLALLPRTSVPDPDDRARQILAVLNLNRVADYEDRSVSAREADTVLKQALRILEWVEDATL